MANGEDPEIIQRMYYYPFGLPMQGNWTNTTQYQDRYTYNHKEQVTGIEWFAYGARYYDAKIGRFAGVDPIADHHYVVSWTTFHYSYNNPIIYTDPDGRLPIPIITGLIGGAGGLIYGLASGKSWKQTVALAAGGFVTGATLGLGGAGVAALGGVEALGGAGTSYIMIGSGVAGGLAGNAVEQGVRIALGESPSFNGEELAISGAFGISEVVLGPAGSAAKNSIKEGLKGAFKNPNRAALRRIQKEIAHQLREQAIPGEISRSQARQAAKQLVQAAQEQRSATLRGIIRFTETGVDVTVSAMQTAVSEGLKTEILEDGKN